MAKEKSLTASSGTAFVALGHWSSCVLLEHLDMERYAQMCHLVSPVFLLLNLEHQNTLLEEISWTKSCTHVAEFDSSSDRKTCPVQCLQCYYCEGGQIRWVFWLRVSNIHQFCCLCCPHKAAHAGFQTETAWNSQCAGRRLDF